MAADGFASSKNGKSACKNFYKPFDFGRTRKRVKKGWGARLYALRPAYHRVGVGGAQGRGGGARR